MTDTTQSLKAIHAQAEHSRSVIEKSFDSNSTAFQDNLLATIQLYSQCVDIAQRISVFSPNESLEDISTADLRYLLLDYRIAELILRLQDGDRKINLGKAQSSYEHYLKQLENYDILSKSDVALWEQFQELPNSFSTASTTDPTARRNTKIQRFKEEKALKQKLEFMRQDPLIMHNDEEAARDLHLTNITFCTHQTWQSLESISQELHILSMKPPSPPPDQNPSATDNRERGSRSRTDVYSDRVDAPSSHLSAGVRGPILDNKGKPLRPFTLTSKRKEFRDGVFRPDHSLPTMSIDEYLEEERKRGGMIEGGGAQSGAKPEIDEDDMDAADAATMKARDWDEYVEANPKGSGNTLNRG
nr:uncharacterized protein C63.05-like [Quercus suber]